MKPIVFLDFDGVLNTDPFLREVQARFGKMWWQEGGCEPGDCLQPELVALLNPLVGKVDFVASTRWGCRLDAAELTAALQKAGFTGTILANTPKKMSSHKCNEVTWYVRDNPKHAKLGYVALDDDNLSYPGHPFPQVAVNAAVGLTADDVARVAARLGVTL